MPNFISEDDIEQGIVQKLQHLYGYDSIDCHTADPADLNDGSGRSDKREVIDYYGVFKRLKKAIKDYGEGADGDDDPPVKDKEKLFLLLDEAIDQGLIFCTPKGVHIQKALESEDVFEKIGLFFGINLLISSQIQGYFRHFA